MGHDPIHRRWQHNRLTFHGIYAFHENFVLPLSHDEVVHGKGSLLGRLPGDEWRRFANLRLLLGDMWTQPGKKLLFMGAEVGQYREWNHDAELDWRLAERPLDHGLRRWIPDLIALLVSQPALHDLDFDPRGFDWIDPNDAAHSALVDMRRGAGHELLLVCDFTAVVQSDVMLGVPSAGRWLEVLNGVAAIYGGSGVRNPGSVEAREGPAHGRPWHLRLTLPPLALLVLAPDTDTTAGSDPA